MYVVKIYVASHCRWAASHVATVLRKQGHNVTSRWHDKAFNPTSRHTELECRAIAAEDVEDVQTADTLVLVAGPDKYSGGKFVEAGIALGLGKRVVVLGRRENMLLWHPNVEQVDDPRGIK